MIDAVKLEDIDIEDSKEDESQIDIGGEFMGEETKSPINNALNQKLKSTAKKAATLRD